METPGQLPSLPPALCDAMLARVLATALYPCLSVTRRCSIKRDEGINLVLGTGPSFDQSCTVF